jgi:hypothetical protein
MPRHVVFDVRKKERSRNMNYLVAGRIEVRLRLHGDIEADSEQEAIMKVKEEFESWLAGLGWITDDNAIDVSGIYAFRADRE